MTKSYEIKMVTGDVNWQEIEKISIDIPYRKPQPDIRAWAQVAADGEGIKLHLWTSEPETRAVEQPPVGFPCQDSCLEFFFCPMVDDNRYFNIEFNSNGCAFVGFGSSIKSLIRLVLPDNASVITPEINKLADGWEIFYTVPFELIRRFFPDFEVYDGKEIKANLYKCSDLGNYPHYLLWNEVVADPYTFHSPQCFGTMKFVKK